MNSQVVKTIDLSYTAPNLPDPMISRSNLIAAIQQLFDSSTETVCVEARSGYGKTILLREFAETCASPCFSVFLRSGSRHSYDPVLARADLANQLHWQLSSRRLDDNTEPTDSQFRTLINRCTRNLIRRNANAYFVVDGLHHIPDEDGALLQAIMTLMPFEIKCFRFLFSSNTSAKIFRHHKTLRVKPFVLTAFTSHESDEFLSDILEDKALRNAHHSALGGVPALLASARRQILSAPAGEPTQSLSLPPDLDAFLEAEWHLLSPLDDSAELLLSYILAYGRPVSTNRLSEYTALSADHIDNLLEPLHFLTSSANIGGWDFASEPFRQYAQKRLRSKVRSATEAIATRLLDDPDSDESLTLLPQYLRKIGNANKILDWFDERRFSKILLTKKTPAWTEPLLRNAIALSHDGRNDRALMTYSILRSMVPQISNVEGIDQEIRARCVMGDASGALAVANAVPLHTQRLRLLAVYVDAASDIPGAPTQSVKAEIQELVTQIDLDSLKEDEAIEIAIDLYPVDPPLALRLLKSIIGDEAQEDSLEISMARITVAAVRSKQTLDASSATLNSAPKTAEILLDERIGKFIEATQLALEAKTPEQILALSSSIERSSERLYVLRKWIIQHPMESDILDVVEFAVSEGIASLDFTPTATFYREVLTPLPYAPPSELRSRLVAMVDAQRPIIKSKGPTVEYVRTQLILAACNYMDGQLERSASQLEELYLDAIEDLVACETRAACLAWCVAELARFDSTRKLDEFTQVGMVFGDELQKVVSTILDQGADQFLILKGALEPLALFVPERALEISSRLNTTSRHNEADYFILKVMCTSRFDVVDFPILFGIVDRMSPAPALDKAISILGQSVATFIPKNHDFMQVTEGYLARFNKSASSGSNSLALAKIAAAMIGAKPEEPLVERIASLLVQEFKRITDPRERYTVGCELIVQLHRAMPDLSVQIFELFSQQKEVSRVGENVEEGSYFILDLLTKSVCALAKANLLHDRDVQRIRHMISDLRNPYLRVCLLSRLAFFLWREQQTRHFVEIVNEDLWNELLRLDQGDRELQYRAWVDAYGVIWLENRDRARSATAKFPASVRIPAVYELCFAILHKIPSGEPFDGRNKRTASVIDYSDVHNLLALCEECQDDETIFFVLEGIADQLTHTNATTKFSRDQRAEAARLMMSIADEHLPTRDGVQHLGYQIVSKAQSLRVSQGTKEDWNQLIACAKNLSNAADRAYVCSLLASYLPSKFRKPREDLLSVATLDTQALNAIEDRYQRYSAIAQVARDIDKSIATAATKNAFQTICGIDDSRNAIREQRLLDLAYSVDPDLPMQFAVLYDSDPAREQYRERAQRQIAKQILKREIGDVRKDIALRERKNEPNLAVAAWQALGTLNAGRTIPVHIRRVRDMIACASNYPLQTAYPMYSWVLSNVMNKYAGTRQASEYIRDMFEGLIRGSHFFFAVTASGKELDFNPIWDYQDEEEVHAVIRVGQRDAAISFLARWLESSAEEFVVIVDPYFGPGDLWVVRLVMETNPNMTVRILTGHAGLDANTISNKSDAYSSAWRDLCEQEPPYTEIHSINLVGSRKTPLHDRWILSNSSGIRLGTSINSIGNKLTELSVMGSNEREKVEYNVNRYLNRTIREEDSRRITYELFELLPWGLPITFITKRSRLSGSTVQGDTHNTSRKRSVRAAMALSHSRTGMVCCRKLHASLPHAIPRAVDPDVCEVANPAAPGTPISPPPPSSTPAGSARSPGDPGPGRVSTLNVDPGPIPPACGLAPDPVPPDGRPPHRGRRGGRH